MIFHALLKTFAPFLKTLSAYRATMRSNVRAAWTGTWDTFEFYEAMSDSIANGLTAAWNEGLESVKATEEDVTPEEKRVLLNTIANEIAAIDGFADFIEEHSKKNKGLLQDCFDRLELWFTRYDQVYDLGALAGGKSTDNYRWEFGDTIEHCDTCSALDGVIASKKDWDASGLRPRNPPNERLECGGWQCDCRLNPTTEPATEGGIPNV